MITITSTSGIHICRSLLFKKRIVSKEEEGRDRGERVKMQRRSGEDDFIELMA